MEAILLDGWMQYVTKASHGSGFTKGTLCEVSFRETRDYRFFVVVRRKLLNKEWSCGRKSDINHPNRVLYFPKPNYWFWPELEDEDTARWARQRQHKIVGLRGHIYLSDLRILKPY